MWPIRAKCIWHLKYSLLDARKGRAASHPSFDSKLCTSAWRWVRAWWCSNTQKHEVPPEATIAFRRICFQKQVPLPMASPHCWKMFECPAGKCTSHFHCHILGPCWIHASWDGYAGTPTPTNYFLRHKRKHLRTSSDAKPGVGATWSLARTTLAEGELLIFSFSVWKLELCFSTHWLPTWKNMANSRQSSKLAAWLVSQCLEIGIKAL